MKEAYVSFEVAKLLKEKGFNIPSDTSYEDYLCQMYDENGKVRWGMYSGDWYFRITQQMACRWLREMKNIDIEPFVYCKHHDGSKAYGCNIQENGHLLMTESFVQDTYEDAIEAALQYCLTNLI